MAAVLDAGITIFPLSVERYHAMIDKGILGSDDAVELLDGLIIVEKLSKNPPHRTSTWATRKALEREVPAGWYVDEQNPITLATSEPEPDVSVVRGTGRDYSTRHPGAADVGMVVQVADATLDRDRGLKKRIYAAAGIPFYWVVNLLKQQLEIYSAPDRQDYRQCMVCAPHQTAAIVLDGHEVGVIKVCDLLP